MNQIDPLERIWGELLSRDHKLVIPAFSKLDPDSRCTVIRHLKDMVAEIGWQKEQKTSAQYALKTIQSIFPEEFNH
jgi:hypothetical protein